MNTDLKKFQWRNILLIAITFGMVLSLVYMVYNSQSKTNMSYKKVIEYFKNDKVKEFKIDNYILEFEVVPEEAIDGVSRFDYKLYSPALFLEKIDQYLENSETLTDYDLIRPKETSVWVSILPTILLVAAGVIMVMMFTSRMTNDTRAMTFSRARLKLNDTSKSKITYADVAGADEEKQELEEVVDFLKSPKEFQDMGATIPKGILLVGPPGTGKTYLAKATAGEAGVPFFSISGSDFVELYVGVGASRVRNTFEQAKKNAPCIVFIDEIDAVGSQRGAGLGGGHDEREQTLNQLLVEMDGFEENEGVIVMAATNRPDVLDSALLRPGRFDKNITINLPDVGARELILKIHARNKPLADDVNLKTIARNTAGFAPAELKNILNESAIIATRRGNEQITMKDIEDAFYKVVMGVEKPSRIVTDEDKKITAYHEAGHAVVAKVLPTQKSVQHISIIPRGMAAGYTLTRSDDDNSHVSKTEMFETIAMTLGGRAAEALCLDDICTGASSDIERATSIARKMVVSYGMSEKLGPVNFGSDNDEVFLGRELATHKNFSEATSELIDEEIKRFIDLAYAKATSVLTEYRDKLEAVAQALLQKEKLTESEFNEIFEH